MTPVDEPPTYAPGSIGLCLSGGGFRASAFHLGTLTYLERIGWLQRVTVLSTVSGGTLTGARYAVALLGKEFTFQRFFDDYYRQLRDTKLFRLALDNLAHHAEPCRSPRRKIITAMADAYAATLYQNPETGLPYQFGHLLGGDTGHLQEIVFNSTEFRTGIAFRFQKTKSGRIGNKYYHLPVAVAGELRLADVVAASSCFPGGFEPLEFPQDFVMDEATRSAICQILSAAAVPDDGSGARGSESLPLMDGGIVDNQGMESLLLADSRLREGGDNEDADESLEDVDVYFISDTDRQSSDLFPYPAKIPLRIDPKLATLRRLVWAGYLLCAASAAVLLGDLLRSDGGDGWWRVLRTAVPLLLVGTAFLLWWIPRLISSRILAQVPDVKAESWEQLKTLRLSEFLDMAMLRGRSLLALAELIFMKRIRSLGYQIIYNDLRRRESIISNFVYHLQKGRPFLDRGLLAEAAAIPNLPPLKWPSKKLEEVTTCAARVSTKLWFDGQELDLLITAGYVTTCYNVLKFLLRRIKKEREEGRDAAPYIAALRPVFEDWQTLAEEPAALLILPATPAAPSRPSHARPSDGIAALEKGT